MAAPLTTLETCEALLFSKQLPVIFTIFGAVVIPPIIQIAPPLTASLFSNRVLVMVTLFPLPLTKTPPPSPLPSFLFVAIIQLLMFKTELFPTKSIPPPQRRLALQVVLLLV